MARQVREVEWYEMSSEEQIERGLPAWMHGCLKHPLAWFILQEQK